MSVSLEDSLDEEPADEEPADEELSDEELEDEETTDEVGLQFKIKSSFNFVYTFWIFLPEITAAHD
jgi:hypothetical protein